MQMAPATKLEPAPHSCNKLYFSFFFGFVYRQVQDFLESEFLGEQVKSIKQLSNHINILKRLNETNYNLGEYQFDKITLHGSEE